jgi:hypothetical protein
MAVDVKVQRLIIDTHQTNPVQLYLQYPESGTNIIAPVNVLNAILEVTDNSGNNLWQTQEDIDKEDEFLIEISILYDLSVSIRINEFEIVNANPGLRP